jgi:hypothetical protein
MYRFGGLLMAPPEVAFQADQVASPGVAVFPVRVSTTTDVASGVSD